MGSRSCPSCGTDLSGQSVGTAAEPPAEPAHDGPADDVLTPTPAQEEPVHDAPAAPAADPGIAATSSVAVDDGVRPVTEAAPKGRRRTVAALIILLVIAGGAYGATRLLDGEGDRGADGGSQGSSAKSTPISQAQAATTTLRLSGRRFHPDQIRMEKGSSVSIRVENRDNLRHNFYFQAPKNSPFVNIDILPRKSAGVSFKAPEETGRYDFYCRFHRDDGMTGTVVVR